MSTQTTEVFSLDDFFDHFDYTQDNHKSWQEKLEDEYTSESVAWKVSRIIDEMSDRIYYKFDMNGLGEDPEVLENKKILEELGLFLRNMYERK